VSFDTSIKEQRLARALLVTHGITSVIFAFYWVVFHRFSVNGGLVLSRTHKFIWILIALIAFGTLAFNMYVLFAGVSTYVFPENPRTISAMIALAVLSPVWQLMLMCLQKGLKDQQQSNVTIYDPFPPPPPVLTNQTDHYNRFFAVPPLN